MKKKEIAELLPNKEDYSLNKAAAASIWVKDFNKGNISSKQIIFGISSSNTPLSKNFINLKQTNLINNSYFYIKNFIRKLPETIKVIIIHNRPHFFFILKKKFPGIKFVIVFHNDPNTLRGSRSVSEKINILKQCDKIIFVSSYVKKKFYYNLNDFLPLKGEVIYPSTNYYNHNFKKKLIKQKIIVFIGKLNSSKGYDYFGPAVINILKKYKDWKVIVAGNEKRETYNFKHERFKIYDWVSHKQIINIYKKSSISIVPSTWEEPFGRTAMESSDMGNVLITSNKGGLNETSINPIVLKKISSKLIQKEIEIIIKNPYLLKKIQKFNYKNKKINFIDNLNKINNLKINLTEKSSYNLNYINNNNNKILHIANFDEKNNFRLSNINLANKISNGFIKDKFQIINFSDRFFLQQNPFSKIDDRIIDIIKNFKPNLLLLGHTNSLKIETLKNVKDKFTDIKIAFWYEDSINKNGPDYNKNKQFIEKYKDYVDQYFVTTDKNNIQSSIPKNKLNFMPVPCSYVCENLNLYRTRNHEFDIFYAVSHGVNRGKLKKNKTDERYNFLKLLMSKSDELTYNIFGFNNIQPVWGDQFIKEISKCKFALNLSRGEPVKYYSSNRIASLVANGIPTLIDKKVKFNDFFSNKEMIFYEDTYDLIDKVNFYKKNERQRIQIGINGKNKYFKIFNNRIIADYIVSKTLGNKPAYKYIWDK
ncbi:GT4_PimA-like domain containing protein [Candidatus Pelagibacterales bacterium]